MTRYGETLPMFCGNCLQVEGDCDCEPHDEETLPPDPLDDTPERGGTTWPLGHTGDWPNEP